MAVHNLRNRLFLPDYGLEDVPLMISVSDIISRPYLRRSVVRGGIKAHLGIRGSVLVDSGGFSFMVGRRTSVPTEDLISLYQKIDADFHAALDIPPAREDSASIRGRKWRHTLRNLDQMLSALGEDRLMPIVHGRTPDEIVGACREIRRRVNRPAMIGLGGMVPFLRGWMSRARFKYRRIDGSLGFADSFVADALSLCRAEFPKSWIHVFGVGSPTTALALLSLGADSVDSLAWRRAAGYGTIFLTGCAERIVSAQLRKRFSRPVLTAQDRPALEACRCPVCSINSGYEQRVSALAHSYVARGVHNVWTLRSEETALRAAKAAGSLASFLASRVHGRHRFSSAVRAYCDPISAAVAE